MHRESDFEVAKDLDPPLVFDYILLKLAARCNINCSYCYWFRDKSVYDLPKILTAEVEECLIEKLLCHIQAYQLPSFSILFHGGSRYSSEKHASADSAP